MWTVQGSNASRETPSTQSVPQLLNNYMYQAFPFPIRRSYTRAFGKALLMAYQAGKEEPRYDLRTRPQIPKGKTDRELFEKLRMGDIWFESQCHKTFFYLYNSKHARSDYDLCI